MEKKYSKKMIEVLQNSDVASMADVVEGVARELALDGRAQILVKLDEHKYAEELSADASRAIAHLSAAAALMREISLGKTVDELLPEGSICVLRNT